MSKLMGYKGTVLELLERSGVEVGDLIRIIKGEEAYEGLLMPRTEEAEDYIVIKLASGYCIGIRLAPDVEVERLKAGAKPAFIPPPLPEAKPGLPKVSIISTGGTIAARVDYRTGAVRPALSASDLYSVVPELSDVAVIKTDVISSIFSENVTPKHWEEMAIAVARHIEEGAEGVVIAHGTDTMAYTSAALSFAVQDLPVPVVLVGAQRSSDRPSSDAAANLLGAVIAAGKGPFAEVCIAMHETTSDKAITIHRGTRVRKCHTSRRDTFKSIGIEPLAKVEGSEVIMIAKDYEKRDPNRKLVLRPKFEEKVALVKFYPGFNPNIIRWYTDQGYYGLILEGTGLGHVGSYCFSALKQAIDKGMFIGMTSQCIWGRVDMKVYDTGRDLLAMGIVPLEDMLAETALAKLKWAFGQTKDVKKIREIMLTNIANEVTPRTVY